MELVFLEEHWNEYGDIPEKALFYYVNVTSPIHKLIDRERPILNNGAKIPDDSII